MGTMIEKKSALKIIFYFIAIDGKISDDEKARWDEIGVELLEDEYWNVKEEISQECLEIINGIDTEDEAYDVILEAVDKLIKNQVEKDGINPRLLIWDLFAITFADNDHSESENRLVNHVARILQVDKSVVAEMKQLIYTTNKVQSELAQMEESMEPYKIIRPLVVELENRLKTLLQSGKELILDESMYRYAKMEERKGNGGLLLNAGKAVGDGAAVAGKAALDGIGFVGNQAVKGIGGLVGGVGKFFGKKEKPAPKAKEITDGTEAKSDEEKKED